MVSEKKRWNDAGTAGNNDQLGCDGAETVIPNVLEVREESLVPVLFCLLSVLAKGLKKWLTFRSSIVASVAIL